MCLALQTGCTRFIQKIFFLNLPTWNRCPAPHRLFALDLVFRMSSPDRMSENMRLSTPNGWIWEVVFILPLSLSLVITLYLPRAKTLVRHYSPSPSLTHTYSFHLSTCSCVDLRGDLLETWDLSLWHSHLFSWAFETPPRLVLSLLPLDSWILDGKELSGSF